MLKGARIAKTILKKKNNFGGLTLSDFTYNKTIYQKQCGSSIRLNI